MTKYKLKVFFRSIKLTFICLRHGINPFSTVGENAKRMRERFSEKEKQWFIDIVHRRQKEYFRKLFAGELLGGQKE